MGLNAFFAFSVALGMKFTWQQALAAVFCSGVIFFLISIFRIREYIINSIPKNLKLAIAAGVGLFLGIIALEQAGIVVAHPATLVTLGSLKAWPAVLCLLGFVLTSRQFPRVLGARVRHPARPRDRPRLGIVQFGGSCDPPVASLRHCSSRLLAPVEGAFVGWCSLPVIDVFDNPAR